MRAAVRSAALTAGAARDLTITAEIGDGPERILQRGFPSEGQEDRRERIWAAAGNSGLRWPGRRTVMITASPAGLPGQPGSDLAAAVAVLAAGGEVPLPAVDRVAFYARLRPGGQLVPVNGTLSAVTAAAAAGASTVVVPAISADEAGLAGGAAIIPASTLGDVVSWLCGGPVPQVPAPRSDAAGSPVPDMSGVRSAIARQTAEVSAAGGHNLLIVGPPGSGKHAIAGAIAGILPPLTAGDVRAVTEIHSRAGLLPGGRPVTRPPFRELSPAAGPPDVLGSGREIVVPGTAALAHGGVLYLGSAPEFTAESLEALRGPVCDGQALTRSGGGLLACFPSRFLLVASSWNCPCYGPGERPWECRCSHHDVLAYRNRFPSWLSGRLPLRADTRRPRPGEHVPPGERSAVIADRVAEARERAARRLAGTPWRLNAQVPGGEMLRRYPPGPGIPGWMLDGLHGRMGCADGGEVLRVAWTLADLSGRRAPDSEDVFRAWTLTKGDFQ